MQQEDLKLAAMRAWMEREGIPEQPLEQQFANARSY